MSARSRLAILVGFGYWLPWAPAPSEAAITLFESGFETGDVCEWATAVPSPENCRPRFSGIRLLAASGQHEISLAWAAAVDDHTPSTEISYEIHLSPDPEFEPDAQSLKGLVIGQTELVVKGLESGTTYYALVIAKDSESAATVSRAASGIATTTLPLILNPAVPLVEAAVLGLGIPLAVTETSLVFALSSQTQLPQPGTLLAGDTSDGGGYLRRVESSSVVNSQIVVGTSPAALADAVDQMEISSIFTLDEATAEQTGAAQELAVGEGQRTIDLGSFKLHTNLLFRPEVEFNTSWRPFLQLASGVAIARGKLSFDAKAEYLFSGAASLDSGPRVLYRTSWIQNFEVESLKLRHLVTAEIVARVRAEALWPLKAQTAASASVTVEFGVRYDPAKGGWEPVGSATFDGDLSASLDVNGRAIISVEIFPRLTINPFGNVAAHLSVVPNLESFIWSELTNIPRCGPLMLSAFEHSIVTQCYASLDLRTFFGASFPILEPIQVCGPFNYPLYSLPQVSLSQEGGGIEEDPLLLTASIEDGVRNPFVRSSALWEAIPASEQLQDFGLAAAYVCGSNIGPSNPRLIFSGYSSLGEAARQCYETQTGCRSCSPELCGLPCLGGLWLDGAPSQWNFKQDGGQVAGTWGYFSCGHWLDLDGIFDGSNISLTATPVDQPGCCVYNFEGTVSDCRNISGELTRVSGEFCQNLGPWSMNRSSDECGCIPHR